MITEKAKDKLLIKQVQQSIEDIEEQYKNILGNLSSSRRYLDKVLLRKPENLHFDNEEDACEHFNEVVYDNSWDGNEAISDILVNCYINGVLYKPVYLQAEFDRGDCCIKMEVVK
jgi:hypothetical protein